MTDSHPPAYDLVLEGAQVLDPSQDLNAVLDVAVRGNTIAALKEAIDAPARERINLHGKILTPGLVDLHTHVYAGVTTWGIKADAHCLATGVTTVVDAGSAGWANFMGLREYVAEPARTQVLAFVHVAGIGLTFGPLGELEDLRYADPERTAFVIRNWSDMCVGVKVRQARFQVGDNGVEPLRLALQAAEMAGVPVMVHIGAGVPLPEVLALLRPNDIVTHCYQGGGDTILGDAGRVIPAVWEARERGVLFDLGHGGGSFYFEVAKKALAQGFASDVISTDIHAHSFEDPVHSLPETACKLLNLGVSLAEVVRQTTAAPAAAIGRGGELGTLKPGTVADLAAFELREGEFEFSDVLDVRHTGPHMLEPVLTVRDGQVFRPAELQEEVAETRRRAREMGFLTGKNFAALGWIPGRS